jgi:hypothetical protein
LQKEFRSHRAKKYGLPTDPLAAAHVASAYAAVTITALQFFPQQEMTAEEKENAFRVWTEALGDRHLADLTLSEVGRALRALSSCYVERRGKLIEGGALAGAGKRAAFALFYGPLHFLIVREIVRALDLRGVRTILDLGCGTGAAGAAWAAEAGALSIAGFDRHPWAVAEARWTYDHFGLSGRTTRADIGRLALRVSTRSGVLAAYAVNELLPEGRAALLPRLLDASRDGASVLVVEPIARRGFSWWAEWAAAFAAAGGRADEWRFRLPLPDLQGRLARAAGLDPRELTARSLTLGARPLPGTSQK